MGRCKSMYIVTCLGGSLRWQAKIPSYQKRSDVATWVVRGEAVLPKRASLASLGTKASQEKFQGCMASVWMHFSKRGAGRVQVGHKKGRESQVRDDDWTAAGGKSETICPKMEGGHLQARRGYMKGCKEIGVFGNLSLVVARACQSVMLEAGWESSQSGCYRRLLCTRWRSSCVLQRGAKGQGRQ